MHHLHATRAVRQATGPAHAPAAPTSLHRVSEDHQTLINIIFGVFAVILAFAALIIAWLQLRKFNLRPDEENQASASANFELVETQ